MNAGGWTWRGGLRVKVAMLMKATPISRIIAMKRKFDSAIVVLMVRSEHRHPFTMLADSRKGALGLVRSVSAMNMLLWLSAQSLSPDPHAGGLQRLCQNFTHLYCYARAFCFTHFQYFDVWTQACHLEVLPLRIRGIVPASFSNP